MLPGGSSRLVAALVFVATALSIVAVVVRFRLEPNVVSLLPDRGEAAQLARYVRAFGGGDLAIVLVSGDDPDETAAAAHDLARDLAGRPGVLAAADRIETRESLPPMLAWRHADAAGRERLARALTPEGMRARLAETRALLLAPGGGALSSTVAADPLRLAQLVAEGPDVGSGVRTQPDGAFATDDGRHHLVLAQPAGQALRGDDARAFVREAESAMAAARAKHPSVAVGLTGGHAIAAATEKMLERDLALSGTVALLLVSLAFAVTFRRLRALAAVMPPLLLGTTWTVGLATLVPGGISAIAVAFMSVVVGVGVDTGVHVYAALLEARREGLDPSAAADAARWRTLRPVLGAALTAALAFGALALSEIRALRQLGILCATGEVLTAVAILAVTPWIGARLENGPPPPAPGARASRRLAAFTSTRGRAALALAFALVPVGALVVVGPPVPGEAFVAVRPRSLEPLEVQAKIFEAFGGSRGQWVVLVDDEDLDRARERTDHLAERLGTMRDDVESVDALTALAPAPATQRARFDERDALDLPARARDLERALVEAGFAPERFTAALDAMRAPPRAFVDLAAVEEGPAKILLHRYLGRDEGRHVVATYVRPRDVPGARERIEAAVRETDPRAALTGYARLESTLKDTLARDLPKIALVGGLLVLLALGASLRRSADVLIAVSVVAIEIALVLVAVRLLGLPLHAYDALVLPVLLGITVDEAMFLLVRARSAASGADAIAAALSHEAPVVSATGLTTAAGFGALVACDFDGLRHLGAVGALGSVAGLVVALVVVPAALRLVRHASCQKKTLSELQ